MPEEVRLTPEQRNSLVAYLDGELPESETAEIEDVLTRSQTARREVEVLSRTWESLEVLERPGASRDFTSRTLTLVKSDALRSEALRTKVARSARRSIVAAICVAGLIAAAVAGFVVTHQVWPDPNRLLTEDLPVVENLDLYLDGGRIDFVRQLAEFPQFRPPSGAEEDDEQEDGIQPLAVIPASLDARRDYVRNLDADRFRRLSRNFQRYQELLERDPDARDRLQTLYQQLQADRQRGGQLLAVLQRYQSWLLGLSPGERSRIRTASIEGAEGERRIDVVDRQLREPRWRDGRPGFRHGRDGRGPRDGERPGDPSGSRDDRDGGTGWERASLTREDFQAVIDWLEGVRFDERERQELESLSPRARIWRIVRRAHEDGDWYRRITDDQWEQLLSELSPAARRELASAERRVLRLREMLGAFFRETERSRRSVGREELDAFFETLDEADQLDLMHFEREERYRRLEDLYHAAHPEEGEDDRDRRGPSPRGRPGRS